MESLTRSFLPHLLAVKKHQEWGWTDGWSDVRYSVKPPIGPRAHNISHYEQEGDSDELEEECDLSVSLPDEILEKILSSLPIAYILRAGVVCKRWNTITTSRRFLSLCEENGHASYGPWYFMYREAQSSKGLAYDPGARKWHGFTLPCPDGNWVFVASSNGLVCFANVLDGYSLYVCNPMNNMWRKMPETSGWHSDYYAVSLMVDKILKHQVAVVARSTQIQEDYSRWEFRIEVCVTLSSSSSPPSMTVSSLPTSSSSSSIMSSSSFGISSRSSMSSSPPSVKSHMWITRVNTVLMGWRGGDNSVICNGVFYCVIHSTAMVGISESRHGLVSYDLSTGVLEVASIPMPCCLTCVKLINCCEKLIMVGGIGKYDIVRGIGIWELIVGSAGKLKSTHDIGSSRVWKEISRMPNKFFRGFGEFDDVFSSSGRGDLIYIHAYGSPQLLLFSLKHRSWGWSQKCPMVKKHPLHLFTGFCFEPNLNACP